MNQKFNFLHQIRPIYYLSVICLALTCGEKKTCAPTLEPKRPNPFVGLPVGPSTTKPALTTKGSRAAVAPSSGSASSSSSTASLPPAGRGSGSASSSSATASPPPAGPGSGSASSSSATASLPPTGTGSGSDSSSSATAGPSTESSMNSSNSTNVLEVDASKPAQEINLIEIEKDIQKVVGRINQRVDAEMLSIENKTKKTEQELQNTWYTGIQWEGKLKWNAWLKEVGNIKCPPSFKKLSKEDQLEYFNQVKNFLVYHLKQTQRPEVIFQELQPEIEEAYKTVEEAERNSAFKSNTNSREIIQNIREKLRKCDNKLKKAQNHPLPDYCVQAEAFQKRCRAVFEAALAEIIREQQRNSNQNTEAISKLLTEIVVQLPE